MRAAPSFTFIIRKIKSTFLIWTCSRRITYLLITKLLCTWSHINTAIAISIISIIRWIVLTIFSLILSRCRIIKLNLSRCSLYSAIIIITSFFYLLPTPLVYKTFLSWSCFSIRTSKIISPPSIAVIIFYTLSLIIALIIKFHDGTITYITWQIFTSIDRITSFSTLLENTVWIV